MSVAAYYPYRSEAVRAEYFRHYDELAAAVWPVAGESLVVPTTWGDTFVRAAGPAGGPALLLLSVAAATSLMWAPNIGRLSEGLRTYAVDQVGEIGRSTCRRAREWVDDLVAWLRELVDALALGATLCGISRWFMIRLMAAAVALRWALPGLVRWMFADMERTQPRWVEETLAELLRVMRTLVPRKVPLQVVVAEEQWRGLPVPVLVGEHETIYPVRKVVERMRRVASGVRVEAVPGAGHDLTSARAELVNERTVEFLTAED